MSAYVVFDVEIRDMTLYNGDVYRNLKPMRAACSSARLVRVDDVE